MLEHGQLVLAADFKHYSFEGNTPIPDQQLVFIGIPIEDFSSCILWKASLP